MSIIALLLTAAGSVLSVAKDRRCFVVWFAANSYWIWFNWPGIQSAVFVIMTITCIVGWFAWKQERPTESSAVNPHTEMERDSELRSLWNNSQTEEITRLRDENKKFRMAWTRAQDTIIELQKRVKCLRQFFRGN